MPPSLHWSAVEGHAEITHTITVLDCKEQCPLADLHWHKAKETIKFCCVKILRFEIVMTAQSRLSRMIGTAVYEGKK